MMFTIKKIVSAFLLPPGIFILLLVFIGLGCMSRRNWRMGLLNVCLGLLLWGLSILPVTNQLMWELEKNFPIPAEVTGDVIILLGGGTLQHVPDLTGTAAPTPLMMGRIVTAVRLHRQYGLPIIVTGGRLYEDDATEAEVAKRFLVDLGVAPDAVIMENRARDTAENARYTATICQRRKFSDPVLLTSAYHLKRAVMAFNSAGVRVKPFPAYFLSHPDPHYRWRDFLPRAGNFYASHNALHEYLGFCYYWIRE